MFNALLTSPAFQIRLKIKGVVNCCTSLFIRMFDVLWILQSWVCGQVSRI